MRSKEDDSIETWISKLLSFFEISWFQISSGHFFLLKKRGVGRCLAIKGQTSTESNSILDRVFILNLDRIWIVWTGGKGLKRSGPEFDFRFQSIPFCKTAKFQKDKCLTWFKKNYKISRTNYSIVTLQLCSLKDFVKKRKTFVFEFIPPLLFQKIGETLVLKSADDSENKNRNFAETTRNLLNSKNLTGNFCHHTRVQKIIFNFNCHLTLFFLLWFHQKKIFYLNFSCCYFFRKPLQKNGPEFSWWFWKQ